MAWHVCGIETAAGASIPVRPARVIAQWMGAKRYSRFNDGIAQRLRPGSLICLLDRTAQLISAPLLTS